MRGIAILLMFNLFGLLANKWLHVPLPANVIGLIAFTICLFLGIVKLEWVEQSAQFLLKHMMLFFAPIIVGTIAFLQWIGQEWLPIAVSLIGGTVVVLLVTGWTTSFAARQPEREGNARQTAEERGEGRGERDAT